MSTAFRHCQPRQPQVFHADLLVASLFSVRCNQALVLRELNTFGSQPQHLATRENVEPSSASIFQAHYFEFPLATWRQAPLALRCPSSPAHDLRPAAHRVLFPTRADQAQPVRMASSGLLPPGLPGMDLRCHEHPQRPPTVPRPRA